MAGNTHRHTHTPLFKQIIHRKSVAYKKIVTPVGSLLFQDFDVWSDEDDNDPVSFPYYKYLLLLVLPYMWDDVADKYPDIFLMPMGNNFSLFSKIITSEQCSCHCMPLELYAGSETINLTKTTQVGGAFSIINISSSRRQS